MVVGNRAAAAFVVVAASATIFSTVFVSVLNWRRSIKFGCSFSWFRQSLAKSGECRELGGKEESRGGTEAVSSSFRQGVIGAIGNTPLIRIHSLSEATGCDIFGKAEFLNPGGSVKDRVAAKILDEALESGALQTGGLVTEGSAGSTAVSLAMVAIAHGCKCHVVLPDDAAIEKTQILEAMGAVVERVRPVSISHREHFVNVARQRALEAQAIVEGTHLRQAGTEDESCSQSKGGFFADQFENLANFRAHYEGTAPEIWAQTGGKVNAFVAAAGTGGTIAGVSCYLKEKNPEVKCYLIDPPGSGLYNSVTRGVMYTREEAEDSY
ncbi:hypothetical protein CY35_10G037100 [Sphagnum magellanicum]|nr:hypothetical protein CY35_10G037100 [Sphagnum magellanicum]